MVAGNRLDVIKVGGRQAELQISVSPSASCNIDVLISMLSAWQLLFDGFARLLQALDGVEVGNCNLLVVHLVAVMRTTGCEYTTRLKVLAVP